MSLQKILLRYEPKQENLLKVLSEIQKENSCISSADAERIAKYFSLSLARVYSVASFFDELETKKSKKKIIRICSGGPCKMEKSAQVLRQLELLLGVDVENDAHPRFKIEFMSCCGLCDRGPIITVDGQTFEKVRPETVDDLLTGYL